MMMQEKNVVRGRRLTMVIGRLIRLLIEFRHQMVYLHSGMVHARVTLPPLPVHIQWGRASVPSKYIHANLPPILIAFIYPYGLLYILGTLSLDSDENASD
jgi:hypothetical protein